LLILRALASHCQALIEGGLERHRPRAGSGKAKAKEERSDSPTETIPTSRSLIVVASVRAVQLTVSSFPLSLSLSQEEYTASFFLSELPALARELKATFDTLIAKLPQDTH
jgi:hypothetical protein